MSIVAQPYQESYPPSLWGGVGGPSTGATAGIPGAFTPAGSTAPASPADLTAGRPYVVRATPQTAWTTGQYVQTLTAGVGGRASWNGTAWVAGVALAADQNAAPPPTTTGEPSGPAGDASEPPTPDVPPPGRRGRRS